MNNTPARTMSLGKAVGWLLFSPMGWVALSAALIGLWAIAHLLGWRDYTSALSGTLPAPGEQGEQLALLGMLYAALYFTAILISPIFAIAGAMRWMLRRAGCA